MIVRKGFIFDLDGVITDTAELHYIAWEKTARKIDIKINPDFNEQLKGIDRIESLYRILEYGDKINQYTETEIEKMAAEKNEYYVELIKNLTHTDLLPGVEDFFKKVRKRKIPSVIASASKNAPFILERLGIRNYFVDIVDPSSVTEGKPNPEIFIKAAKLIDILPEEAVGFEDAQSGIDGMKACGIYAIGVTSEKNLKRADILTQRLDLLDIDRLLSN